MKSRRLQFWAAAVALLFLFEPCATANNAACVYEHIEFTSSHRCFPSPVTVPLSTVHTNSPVTGTLGGAFMRGPDDSRNSSMKRNILRLYPAPIIPGGHSAQNGPRDPLSILLRMIFLPKGPRHSALLRPR